MNARRVPSILAFAALGLLALPAGADEGAKAPADVVSLSASLDAEISKLSLNDCATACESLQSIRRTADRICAIDPGPPCARARDKVAGATKRVEAACPTCATAPGVVDTPRPAPGPMPADAPAKSESVKGHGGCAACTVGDRDATGAGAWALALGALLWLGRRRKRASRPPR